MWNRNIIYFNLTPNFMREGFEFIDNYRGEFSSTYGGIKKKQEVQPTVKSRFTAADCLVFVKDSIISSGKFKTNPINYIFTFFPAYVEYMLQAAPYFFIREDYLEELEKYQPIYDIGSAFDFLKEKNRIVIDKSSKIITFKPLGEFENNNGMLILPNVKVIKNNYTFSAQAKKSNQRQYKMAVDSALNKKYGMERLANTLGYCTNGEIKQNYVPAPKPLIYDEEEYSFKAEK